MRAHWTGLLVAMVCAAAPGGCRREAQPTPTRSADHLPVSPGAAKGRNVLLITVDTLRRDRVSLYSHEHLQTPAIDSLAASGAVFEDVVTPVPITLPSHTTIMTGLLPLRHGVRVNVEDYVRPGTVTLAGRLHDAGYRTAAFVACMILDARYGLNQGFDAYNDKLPPELSLQKGGTREAQVMASLATYFLRQTARDTQKRPFFAWVHFYDPHAPYQPPPPYREGYGTRPYDGEVAYVDNEIGRILEALRETGLADNTLVVLASDHGESLGEHGYLRHAMLIYESIMRVPLVIHAPGLINGSVRVQGQVGLADVMPTVLDLLGLPIPDGIDGRSLLRRDSVNTEAMYLESLYGPVQFGWAPLRGLRTQQYKYVLAPKPELYDLTADPCEIQNLVGAKPTVARELKAKLEALLLHESRAGEHPVAISQAERERLESLGYLASDPDVKQTGADPKDMLWALELFEQGQDALREGDPKTALALFGKVTESGLSPWRLMRQVAMCYMALDQWDRALQVYQDLAQRLPDSPTNQMALGSIYLRLGDLNRAAQYFSEAIRTTPNPAMVHVDIAESYLASGNTQLAYEHLEAALKADADCVAARMALADLYRRLGRVDRAIQNYEAVAQTAPTTYEAHYHLAMIYSQQGTPFASFERARAHSEAALQLAPYNYRSHVAAARAAVLDGRFGEAAKALETALELAPDRFKPAIKHELLSVGAAANGAAAPPAGK